MKRTRKVKGIWPETVRHSVIPRIGKAEDIEFWFESNFKGGFPVVVSSGRAAIGLISRFVQPLSNIELFPFASQCVVNAFMLNGVTPNSSLVSSKIPKMIYHQWGYSARAEISTALIEDSVDSFFPIGSNVRRADARFEIWSLSKILGLRVGAIIWCKNQNDATELRILIGNSSLLSTANKSFFRFSSRSRSKTLYRLWEKMECLNPRLMPWELGHIFTWVQKWEEIYLARKNRILNAAQSGENYESIFYNDYSLETGDILILPSVLILKSENLKDINLTESTNSMRFSLHCITYRDSFQGIRKVEIIPTHLI